VSEPAPVIRRESFRSRLQKLPFARENQMFGPAEIIALGVGVFMVVITAVSYIYFLIPANSRLEALQTERALKQKTLISSNEAATRDETAQATVQRITQSLDDFESNQLLNTDRGRMVLYDSLNDLIRKASLRNTSGPTYAALQSSEEKKLGVGKTVNTRWQSIYPGIAISVTVEGPYQNLRRFIRDLETTKQFVIINSVELERSTEANSTLSSESTTSDGGRSSLVSLRLEMATYFQRAGRAGAADESVSR
jgi:Tfp pilus assembly protein PilO